MLGFGLDLEDGDLEQNQQINGQRECDKLARGSVQGIADCN